MISDTEKKIIAYHESGHTLVAKSLPSTDPVHKVSIVSRGPALGYTLQLPLEDKYLTGKQELLARLAVLLGGRAAEELVFGEVTTGAHNDLAKATDLAARMVTEFGMSDRIGPLSFARAEGEVFLGRDLTKEKHYSDKMLEIVDDEVRKLVEDAKTQANKILRDNQTTLNTMADALVERENLDSDELELIMKGQPLPPMQIAELPVKLADNLSSTADAATIAAPQGPEPVNG
jgi:cell division protease FtsH